MMLKKKSNPWARLKYAYVLPLAAISVVAFARTEVSQPVERLSDAKVSDLSVYLNQNAEKSTLSTLNVSYKELTAPQKPKKKVAAKAQKKVTKSVANADDNKVYDRVEVMPEFPGGEVGLYSYIANNMIYPKIAAEYGIEGKLIVEFVIDKNGQVRDAAIKRTLQKDCDAEALRLVRAMPRWTPANEKGVNVNIRYVMPLVFKLNK